MDRLEHISRGVVRWFGECLTFSRISESAYDPGTGMVSGGSTIEYRVKVLLREYTPSLIALSNGIIRTGDRRAAIADNDYTAQPGDRVSVNGITYQVIETTSHLLAGMQELHLRPL